jgi:DNA-binding LacI/PurR family transcriptional regulator
MGKGFVTAAEVAALAGVSRSAVSRTFTPGASVSPNTRARVTSAAEQSGYRVNRLAQSLIRDRSHLVGIIAANLDTPFNAALLSGLSQALPKAGLQSLLFNAADAADGITPLIERIMEFRARAVVVLSGSPPSAIVEECLRRGLRVVLVNKPMRGVAADTIVSDDLTGARLAADRLVKSGATRLAVVASGSRTPGQVRRVAAFRARAGELGFQAAVWSDGATSYETGQRAARALLTARGPDGVFCVTDLLAFGFMDVARHELRLRVPDDLGVIGFDDVPQADWLSYRLTTIRQSIEGLCSATVAAVSRDGRRARRATVPVELVERGSVRPSVR